MVNVQGSASPRLRLRKRIPKVDGAHIGCSVGLDGVAHFDAALREPWLKGRVELTRERVEWRKMWLFPGLVDAATRVELRSALDLRDGHTSSELRLGLRGIRPRGLSLVHRVPIRNVRVGQLACDCSVDVGATLVVPEELKLGLSGCTVDNSLHSTKVDIDFDRLDLCVEVS